MRARCAASGRPKTVHLPRQRRDDPQRRLEQRRLAGAVRPDDRGHRARPQRSCRPRTPPASGRRRRSGRGSPAGCSAGARPRRVVRRRWLQVRSRHLRSPPTVCRPSRAPGRPPPSARGDDGHVVVDHAEIGAFIGAVGAHRVANRARRRCAPRGRAPRRLRSARGCCGPRPSFRRRPRAISRVDQQVDQFALIRFSPASLSVEMPWMPSTSNP